MVNNIFGISFKSVFNVQDYCVLILWQQLGNKKSDSENNMNKISDKFG